jgi:hydrogenase maturation protein HypF
MPVHLISYEQWEAGWPEIVPDRGICQECRRELTKPGTRHYRFPLIHCNRCGPRASILEVFPFRRSNTSLRNYPPCPDCLAEQSNPSSRRFRLETITCPRCGPQVRLERADRQTPKPVAQGSGATPGGNS